MKKVFWLVFIAMIVLLPAGRLSAQGAAENILLANFEDGTDGWKIDWGCSIGGPEMVTGEAHDGKSSAAFSHHFEKEQEAAAAAIVFSEPKNFSGYKTLSAWVYFPPKSYDWQAQLYVRSGEGTDPVFGKLEQGLKAGWHQIQMDALDVTDIVHVREIGVQVKNFTIDREMKFHIDQVEALVK